MLTTAAGIQHLGLIGNLCRSSEGPSPLSTAAGHSSVGEAELSSSSQGYTRLVASRHVPASARGRGRSRNHREVQGCQGAGLEALAGMAKHSALEPSHPYKAGRTHCLHDGELSSSNTPLPVGKPSRHAAVSHGWTMPSLQAHTLPGRQAMSAGVEGDASLLLCHMFAGTDGPSLGSLTPTDTPPPRPGLEDPHVHPKHPLQLHALQDMQLQEAAKLPDTLLTFWMLFRQIVAVQMHLCIFPSWPLPSPSPPPRKMGL